MVNLTPPGPAADADAEIISCQLNPPRLQRRLFVFIARLSNICHVPRRF